MKKLISLIMATLILCSLAAFTAGAADNLIKNGNFEGSDMSQYNTLQLGMPDNMPVVVSEGRNGSKCIEMGGDREGMGWPTWVNFRVGNLTLKKNASYKFDGWVRGTENIILTVQAHLFANTKAPNKHREVYHPISAQAMGEGVHVTTSWTKFSIEFTMTNEDNSVNSLIVDATDWNIFFAYDTYWNPPQAGVTFPKSSMYFDDLTLTEVQPVAAQSIAAQPSSKTTTAASTASVAPAASQNNNTATASMDDESEFESELESQITDGTESDIDATDISSSADSGNKEKSGESNFLIVIIIVLLAVILLGGGAALYFLVIKAKPEDKKDEE